MAGHSSARTTGLYHRIDNDISLDECLHTRGVYHRDAGKLLAFTRKTLREITLDDLQVFASELAKELAPISVGRTLAAVRSLMRFASRSGYLAKNVAADLKLPRSENRLAERILGEEDVRRLISLETDPRNRVDGWTAHPIVEPKS